MDSKSSADLESRLKGRNETGSGAEGQENQKYR